MFHWLGQITEHDNRCTSRASQLSQENIQKNDLWNILDYTTQGYKSIAIYAFFALQIFT